MASKTFNVLVPIAGAVHVGVEADTEKAAADLALEEAARFLGELEGPDCGTASLESLEAYDKIAEGNVCHVSTREIEIEEAG